ncbi:site-specific integrase [Arthrobacter sp. NPDC056691]|uniref:site-specific integrase n=1 Tax=Arthrobacter sp. NPDC056691 TaxID=3345913 RepID=UPI00366D7172
MAKIDARARWDGSTAYSVRWRDLGTRHQRRVTLRSEQEAQSLVQYLNDNGRMHERAPGAAEIGKAGVPTIAQMVQEHIDLLVRPSPGTVRTYQGILDLHIRNTIGHIPVDALGYRELMQWVKGLLVQGIAPKSIHNMHGLLSSAMRTAELLQYVSRNPCHGIALPTVERTDDDTVFLTHSEFSLLLNGLDEHYRTFVKFLVMTGALFGEATAIRVADIDLVSRPPTARINKAWKRDGQSHYYVGPTKTAAGRRTVGLNPALALIHRC